MSSSPWLFKFSFVIFFLPASSTKARSNACFEDRRAITWQLEAFIARSVDWNGWLAKMASIVEAGTHCEWHSAGLRCDATVYFPGPGRCEKWSGETNSCVALFVAPFSLPSRTSGSWQYPNWRRAVAPKLDVLLDWFLVHQFLRFLGRFSPSFCRCQLLCIVSRMIWKIHNLRQCLNANDDCFDDYFLRVLGNSMWILEIEMYIYPPLKKAFVYLRYKQFNFY